MRSMLRRLTIAGGIGAVLAVVLLALAAGLGSWALALVGGSLGALLVIGGTSSPPEGRGPLREDDGPVLDEGSES